MKVRGLAGLSAVIALLIVLMGCGVYEHGGDVGGVVVVGDSEDVEGGEFDTAKSEVCATENEEYNAKESEAYKPESEGPVADYEAAPETEVEEDRSEQANDKPLHPFAIAILEFFDGGVEVPPDWGMRSSTFAHLVDIDGKGTIGVLAIRHESYYDHWPFSRGKIFYMLESELVYKDLGILEGFPLSVAITAESRPVIVTGDGGQWSYTLLKFQDGRLIEDFTIVGTGKTVNFHDYFWYYHFYGGWFPDDWTPYHGGENWRNRQRITEDEFNAIRIRYGLFYVQNWLLLWGEDDTQKILEMTYLIDI